MSDKNIYKGSNAPSGARCQATHSKQHPDSGEPRVEAAVIGLLVEHATTQDDEAWGPVLPSFAGDGWRVVRHANGFTVWRRLSVAP